VRANVKLALVLITVAYMVLWTCFWIDFSRRLIPYQEHRPVFEEMLPIFVFFGKALPIEQTPTSFLRQMKRVEAPSFLAVRPAIYLLNQRPVAWQTTFGGVSPWGYLRITIMFLSFLQWCLIIGCVAWFLRRVWPEHQNTTNPSV
jgi:hypothetical protein